jgi:hypothetical protein
MIHRANADFWKDYHVLPADIRVPADKQFALLKDNPQHPSLQFKKIGDAMGGIASTRFASASPARSHRHPSRRPFHRYPRDPSTTRDSNLHIPTDYYRCCESWQGMYAGADFLALSSPV